MIRAKLPLTLAAAGALALSACTDTGIQTSDPDQRTKEGVAIGAALGAVTGALVGDDSDSRNKGAIVGGIIGAGVGGVIGNQLDKQAADLRNDFDNSAINVVNTGDALVVTMPQDILFAVDSSTVSASLQSDLRVLANSLNEYPNTTIEVIGHTDNTGDAGYNQALSARRATAVTSVLQNAGVSASRLRSYGRGEDSPVASNLNAEGRALNRRVEIIIRPNA
ncbi:OmpA family protein [Actibacterium lipolyticum]|uniref:Putative lipoprotein YiaD n=1 Tax=Actibacterium lipolyticum TaxID=1524263 RepID=A0A238KS67_9RHOB|nr:OmpA family protein [Actibacterium lipolyticum]SMX45558.1 putative lipoprotein YiaD precursor [Actibacterium lipolyticum]